MAFSSSTPVRASDARANARESAVPVHLTARRMVAAAISIGLLYGLVEGAGLWSLRFVPAAAAARRLKSAGFAPRFVAPSTTDVSRAVWYFDGIISVPGARNYVTELSYHCYSGVSDANLLAIALRAEQHGIDSSMLEHIGSGHEDLYKDLTLGRVSAWQQFVLAPVFGASKPANDNGGSLFTVDISDPYRPKLRMMSRTRYLRQYFKFVRAGALRVAATTSNTQFEPVAFVSRDEAPWSW